MSTLTVKLKLVLSADERDLVLSQAREYIGTVNAIVRRAVSGEDVSHLTTGCVKALLPSALKNQCIRDARSVIRAHAKRCGKAAAEGKEPPAMSVLKKKVLYVNNQNWSYGDGTVSLPLYVDGKCRRVKLRACGTDQIPEGVKKGILRIALKGGIYAFAAVTAGDPPVPEKGKVMGVDLGIKCPAVSYCGGRVKFYGNGRQNRAVRRKYASRRKKLQKHRNRRALRRLADKEQRFMRDQDHKVSRAIVDEAARLGASEIRLEELSDIRRSAGAGCRTSRKRRKNNRSLHSWSFSRLAGFIRYKAALAGIRTVFIRPEYTSQECPVCGRFAAANGNPLALATGRMSKSISHPVGGGNFHGEKNSYTAFRFIIQLRILR